MEDLLLDSIPQRKSARVTSDPKVEEAIDSIVFLPLESADTKSRDTPGEGVALSYGWSSNTIGYLYRGWWS